MSLRLAQLRCWQLPVLMGLAVAFMGPAVAGPAGKAAVRAELLSATTAVKPGDTIEVGVRLVMAPGWHTYWLNPGDAGQATLVNWQLPAGCTATAIDWPVPKPFEMSGLVSAGYAGEVIHVSRITVPADFAGASVEIAAAVEWLMCDDNGCFPGDAVLKLSLATGPATVSSPTVAAQFAGRKLPQPLPEGAAATAKVSGKQLVITISGLPGGVATGSQVLLESEGLTEPGSKQGWQTEGGQSTVSLARGSQAWTGSRAILLTPTAAWQLELK